MSDEIRVLVTGATGRMGQAVVQAVLHKEGMQVVGGVHPKGVREPLAEKLGLEGSAGLLYSDLREALLETRPDVAVDFTKPSVVGSHMEIYQEMRVRPVVGTSGITESDVAAWRRQFQAEEIGGLIVPNFTIGAVLMMKFAAMAAKYIPHVEIIEYHHDQKLDAPSGTAVKTAEMIASVRERIQQGHPSEQELWQGARGAQYEGMRIHSVRMPGYLAHQEVIFGSAGQTLSIRHDSVSREAYMPGVLLAIAQVMNLRSLEYGLDAVMD